LGEHSIWGKHSLFEESLRSPLIISYPGMPYAGKLSHSMVETIDVFPTLVELSGLPKAKHADGVSLKPILESPNAPGHDAFGYFGKDYGHTIRTETHRMIAHTDGYIELYDHRTLEGETRNVADQQPEVVAQLKAKIEKRFKNR
jgi:iduronate 2-sulfatase